MVAKTRGKKQRSKRTTQKQHNRDISTLRKQHGGDDPAIEGIIYDIKTLTTKIAKPHTDGPKFKTDMIDSFYPIVSAFNQHIIKDITKKDLTALSKSLEAFLKDIELNQPKLTQFYPSFYSEVIPQKISIMIKETQTKLDSMSTIVTEPIKPSKKQQEKIKKQLKEAAQLEKERLEKERLEKERLEKERLEKERLEKERLEKERLENERLENERLENERLETLLMDVEHTHSKKAEETHKSILYAKQRRLKRQQNENLLKESNKIKEETTQFTQQFNIEIAQLFNAFIDIFEKQFELLQDSKKLVSIVKTIYPNVLNYTDKIQNQSKDDKFLYKYYSFYLLIFIGMLNHFLKTRVPELKLVIKGGKAAQMILSPNPTLDLKSDDIDVLVQHPDPIYAKIFSQHFATFFEQQIQDTAHVSVLLANPTNPNVVKISYITTENRFVVISDIDSKPLPNPELFDIIETKKSKDIVIVEDEVETTYPFRLTYYHQTIESFLKEKKYYRDFYSGLPPSDINSRFATKASEYLTIMAPKAPPPSPSSPEKYETFMPPSPPK